MVVYAAPKFASDLLYDAIEASWSMAAMPYPCCKAGAAVWLTSVIVSAQYYLKESIVSAIGRVSFSRAIQFLYSSEYIPHRLITRRLMSMTSRSSIG